ncbi:hypothetical protein HYS82_02215 [Candidatus Amesbacteria bacterium]|nr:hypothetical protein [Candidatus Amesbacteria bacterium]
MWNGQTENECQVDRIDSGELYRRMIGGKEKGRLPEVEKLPNELIFPPGVWDDLPDAMRLSETDKRERSQGVFVRNGELSRGKIFKGMIPGITSFREAVGDLFRVHFGREKMLVHWHTHPGGSLPNYGDFEGYASLQRWAYTFGVAAIDKIYLFAQSAKAAEMPFSAYVHGIKASNEYPRGKRVSLGDIAKVAERFGFGFYASDINQLAGESASGLRFSRIRTDNK